MKTFRYLLIMLFALAPAFAVAQGIPAADSLTVDIGAAEDLPAYESNFGFDIEGDEGEVVFGPLPFVTVEGDGTTPDVLPEEGCDPFLNADEVAGNVAVIARGNCAFVTKVQNASAAGAAGVVIYVADPTQGCGQFDPAVCGEDGVVFMGGDCTPEEGCDIPAVSVSVNSGQEILDEIKFDEEGTFTCERCTTRPGPPPASTAGVHDTGELKMTVYDYGYLGANASFGQEDGGVPFEFNGVQGGLFVSSVLIGQADVVNSNPYAGGELEFTSVTPVEPIMPAPAPFDEAFETSYTADDFDDVLITQRSYSRQGNPFVIVDIEVQNNGTDDLEDLFIGIFADWDIIDEDGDPSDDDLGAYNEALAVPYVFDETMTQYYGVTAVNGDEGLSGYSTEAGQPLADDDAQLFNTLISDNEPGADPVERATVTGTGSYDVEAGESVTVRFAYVAGETEAEFLINVAEARTPISSTETTTPEGTFTLESAFPNPSSSSTKIGFELPAAQDVTLTVYDVLGREVAVLMNGVAQSGRNVVEFDAASLPSGVYFYRLDAGATQLTERMTVVR